MNKFRSLMHHAFPLRRLRLKRPALAWVGSLAVSLSWAMTLTGTPEASPDTVCLVGVASVDITPDYPVLMNGYYHRREESKGVLQRIHAKALALGSDVEGPAVLVSLDNCGLPGHLRVALLERLAEKGITDARLVLCASHTHAAPKLAGSIDNIFGADIPPEQQARVDRYTRELLDHLELVALTALKQRQPARLSFGQTRVGFANNRRVPGGPVDHDLPILQVTDLRGETIALVVNYACHCTTLSAENTLICGDWAGYAQEAIERKFPGAVALTLIGCGAESNPSPSKQVAHAQAHGQTIADAVRQRVAAGLTTLPGPPECRSKWIRLPFDPLPTLTHLEELGRRDDPTGYNARKQLARLDRGESLPSHLPYPVQTWSFAPRSPAPPGITSGGLVMVFLAGEVVADYSLRLKQEFDRDRLWVTAYANEVPCYIPSRRVWKMHGYETELSMVYYDRPTRLAEGVEDLIIATVHELIPRAFQAVPRDKSVAEKAKLHVYLLMGQSNMRGRGIIESPDRTPHPRVLVHTASNYWELAVEPVHGSGPRAGIGPGLVFGKRMAAGNTNASIGLVPCAVGASLLSRWERGGDLYANAVARAQAAQRDGTLAGILWHQGEQDSMTATNASTYYDRLVKMIADLRADLGQPELPFVVGQIGEFLYERKVQQTPFARTVNDALARIPDAVPFSACVSATGLTHVGDEVHLDGKSQRELGKRFAMEMQKLTPAPAPSEKP